MVFGPMRSGCFIHDACYVNLLLSLPSILRSWFNSNKQLFGFCNCYQTLCWHFVWLMFCVSMWQIWFLVRVCSDILYLRWVEVCRFWRRSTIQHTDWTSMGNTEKRFVACGQQSEGCGPSKPFPGRSWQSTQRLGFMGPFLLHHCASPHSFWDRH